MREANSNPTTPRRGLLAALAMVPISTGAQPGVPVGPSPDAELLELSAEFDALELQIQSCDLNLKLMNDEAFNAATDPLNERQEGLLPRMIKLRATTPAGIVARARTLAIHGGHGGYSLDVDYSTCAGSMVAALLRDVLTMHGLPLPEALLEEG